MRALIINQHSNNFGDDAAGCALVNLLLEHKNFSRIDIMYNSNKEIPVDNPKVIHHLNISFGTVGHKDFILYYLLRPFGLKVRNHLMLEWINLIKQADVVFMSPCGANIGIYKDWASLIRILMVIIERKDMIFHYNTIGKSGNILFDFFARYALKRSFVYVREKKSKEYLDSLGINAIWGPDTAFSLECTGMKIRKDVVSFVPSSFDKWHPEFKNAPIDKKVLKLILPQIANWVNKHQYKLEILPHTNSCDELRYNKKIYRILKNLNVKNVVIRKDILNVWDYDNAISTSLFSIGMRYHTIVLSAKNKRPFISLCYENKMKEVSNYVNMNYYIVDLKEITRMDDKFKVYSLMEDIVNKENEICSILENKEYELKELCRLPIKRYLETKSIG